MKASSNREMSDQGEKNDKVDDEDKILQQPSLRIKLYGLCTTISFT